MLVAASASQALAQVQGKLQGGGLPAAAPAGPKVRRAGPLRVAVILDGGGRQVEAFHNLLRREAQAVFADDRPLQWPAAPYADGHWQADKVAAALARALADPAVDVVLGLGVLVGNAVAQRETLPKPVLLPLVPDPALQALPVKGGHSGRPALNYLTGLYDLPSDLQRLKQLTGVARVAVLLDDVLAAALPGLAREVAEAAQRLGMRTQLVTAGPEADALLAAWPAQVEGAYLLAFPRSSVAGMRRLLTGLRGKRVPVFTATGPRWVKLGALATLSAHKDTLRRARRVALNLQRIGAGEPAGSLAVNFEPQRQLILNLATARAVGARPDFETLTEAVIVGRKPRRDAPHLNLRRSVRWAAARNLSLRAEATAVRVGEAQVRAQRASLLPAVGAGLGAQVVDPDLASSFGQAQRGSSWQLEGVQPLYREDDWARFEAEKHQQRSRERAFAGSRLDLVLATGEAYFNVLRAKTQEGIEREYLQLARANLALARVRKRVGVARATEVYRWQIEIAKSLRRVINASARRNQGEIALNRLLNRPLEAPMRLSDDKPMQEIPILAHADKAGGIDDPLSFRVFRGFMVREGVKAAPELKRLNASLKAQARRLKGQKRQLWLPEFNLAGDVNHNFWRDGRGAGSPTTAPTGGLSFPDPSSVNWTAGANASLPLFGGLGRLAGIDAATREFLRLRTERQSTQQRIEESIRAALHQAGASRAGIGLAERAATAALKNLEATRDAYGEGTVDILTLLDAQTQSLVAALDAAGAVYDYLIDYLRVERAVGRFDIERGPSERRAFVRRWLQYSARASAATTGTARSKP